MNEPEQLVEVPLVFPVLTVPPMRCPYFAHFYFRGAGGVGIYNMVGCMAESAEDSYNRAARAAGTVRETIRIFKIPERLT